jgi:hypothetical protein
MRLTAKGVREEGDYVWPKGVLVFNAGVQEREENRDQRSVSRLETRFLKFQVDSRRFLWAPPPSVSSLIVFSPVSRHPCYRLPRLGHKLHSDDAVLRAEKKFAPQPQYRCGTGVWRSLL